jgi:hypothetical protein
MPLLVSPFNHSLSLIKYCKVGFVSPSKILWLICGAKKVDLSCTTRSRVRSERFIGCVSVGNHGTGTPDWKAKWWGLMAISMVTAPGI